MLAVGQVLESVAPVKIQRRGTLLLNIADRIAFLDQLRICLQIGYALDVRLHNFAQQRQVFIAAESLLPVSVVLAILALVIHHLLIVAHRIYVFLVLLDVFASSFTFFHLRVKRWHTFVAAKAHI